VNYNPLASIRAKVAVLGVLTFGAFTGAAYADTLPAPVQRTVSDVASNLGLSVPGGQTQDIAPLEVVPTTPGAATTTVETNVDNGIQNDKNDGAQSDGAQNDTADDNVDNGTQNNGANDNVDNGTQNDGANDNADEGAKNDGAQDNADEGQQENVDQGNQGDVSEGDGNG
jgi:hypothetical protein